MSHRSWQHSDASLRSRAELEGLPVDGQQRAPRARLARAGNCARMWSWRTSRGIVAVCFLSVVVLLVVVLLLLYAPSDIAAEGAFSSSAWHALDYSVKRRNPPLHARVRSANRSPSEQGRSGAYSSVLPSLGPAHVPLGLNTTQKNATSVLDAVDAVYTWVDASDPVWAKEAERYFASEGYNGSVPTGVKGNKFREWNELLYSMRSLSAYAPWVRNIYIVTSGPTQVPVWLNASHPRIHIVHHAALFDNPQNELPTYNSFAIESVLHRITGLSNYFLYLNNDFILGRDVLRSDFITDDGAYVRYQDWGIIPAPKCRTALIGARGLGLPADDAAYLPCRNVVNGWDTVLSMTYWGLPITHWFVHMPHLWERRVLYAVEAILASHLAVMRRSRVRNVTTDVNIHVHYESWRAMMALRGEPGELRIVSRATKGLRVRGRPGYMFSVFDNGCESQFYGKLDAMMMETVRPLFVAVDDDLLQPTDRIIAYNRERLTAWFQRNWPDAGPWELRDRVPPTLDPASFVATPPPPPTPSRPPRWLRRQVNGATHAAPGTFRTV